MSVDNKKYNDAYGLNQALINVMAPPIVSARNPTTRDKAQFGQTWVNKTTGVCFKMTRIVANSYTWYAVAAAAAAYTAAGLVTAGTGLIATTGAGTPSTRGLHVVADGASITGLTTITGNTDITGTLSVTGITTQIGALNVTGAITASTSIGATTTLASGTTITSGTSISSTTTITAGTGLTVTAGNCTLTNGNLVLSTAATYVSLPGPVFIRSGAGAPANGLALHIGDLYIRTDAGAAAERLYVATGVGAWTTVNCAA